ncbi:hypothetical protein EJ08DRAFT_650498 [Tothia fuscella]|uniref:Uncharacterized protein n=1 Tax=Tothia fuscella TaxID=1048955 RepID=A0A9P4NPS9_9PEZI|nr:hypothetical protein EJ08DRAFT_650498 [Tothia fuscella]
MSSRYKYNDRYEPWNDGYEPSQPHWTDLVYDSEEERPLKFPKSAFKRDAEGCEWDPEGYNDSGYNKEGFSRQGLDRFKCDRNGMHRELKNVKFDSRGFDRNGLNIEGYNRQGKNEFGYTVDTISAMENDPKFLRSPKAKDWVVGGKYFHDRNFEETD